MCGRKYEPQVLFYITIVKFTDKMESKMIMKSDSMAVISTIPVPNTVSLSRFANINKMACASKNPTSLEIYNDLRHVSNCDSNAWSHSDLVDILRVMCGVAARGCAQ